jgi:hypothetical protein
LITSRKYYNFMTDDARKGDTVKPFNPKQSYDLLFQLLGDNWNSQRQQNLIAESEVDAAKEFLERLEGLGLAIQQASVLIKNEKTGGYTIESTLDAFKQNAAKLPERQKGRRSETYHALDTLWDMSFGVLPNNARQLLSVLALLSPGRLLWIIQNCTLYLQYIDTTYIELFLPRRQAVCSFQLQAEIYLSHD